MPLYNSPLTRPMLLQKGVPAYLFGNLNMFHGNTSGYVTNTTLASNVGSVTVQILEGPLPNVGDLITIWATTSQTGLFNVIRAVITAVNITLTTGIGTISYALTGTNQGATADPGHFLCEAAETAETLTAGTFSIPIVVQPPSGDSQFTLPFAVTFPTMPTAATVTLQRAIRDINAEYTNTTSAVVVAGSAFTAGPVIEPTLERGYVYRFAVTGVTGSGTIVAKVG